MASPSTGPVLHPVSARTRYAAYALAALVAAALGFGGWGVWKTFHAGPRLPSPAQWQAQQARMAKLEQQVATLARSDTISRNANRDLQNTLAERDEEIASLRSDVAFYERLVGGTAQRHGLNVHELKLAPQGGQAWHFTATLSQNVTRGAANEGELTLAVEGTRDGQLQRLDWDALRQQAQAAGVDYSFKYFQQVEGDLFLPPGFQPVRVAVRLRPRAGAPVESDFTWAQALGAEPGA